MGELTCDRCGVGGDKDASGFHARGNFVFCVDEKHCTERWIAQRDDERLKVAYQNVDYLAKAAARVGHPRAEPLRVIALKLRWLIEGVPK